MSFRLPGEDDEFYFLVEVRQVRAVEGQSTVRIGLKIKAWPTRRDLDRMQGRIQRYLTVLQRQKLKKAS
jgi:hypothetical protein